jgi:hypothetical protein
MEEYGPKREYEAHMDMKQQQRWQDQKRNILRMIWERWHSPKTDAPVSSGTDDDEVAPADVVAETRKRGRSQSTGRGGDGDKRRKVDGENDAEDEA